MTLFSVYNIPTVARRAPPGSNSGHAGTPRGPVPLMNALLIMSDGHSRETAGRYGPEIRSANLTFAVPYSIAGKASIRHTEASAFALALNPPFST